MIFPSRDVGEKFLFAIDTAIDHIQFESEENADVLWIDPDIRDEQEILAEYLKTYSGRKALITAEDVHVVVKRKEGSYDLVLYPHPDMRNGVNGVLGAVYPLLKDAGVFFSTHATFAEAKAMERYLSANLRVLRCGPRTGEVQPGSRHSYVTVASKSN
jgi:spermidine synthase